MTEKTAAAPVFDDGVAEEYPPHLYRFDGIATGVADLDSVTDADVARFQEEGYLIVEQAFTPQEVQEALDGLFHLISGQNPDFKVIMLENVAKGLPIAELSPDARQDYVRKFMWFVEHDERLKALSQHPKLLAVLTRLIGDTPFLFQDMALIKPPRIGREKPWHQDHAYFNLPLETPVVGAWIALDEATPDNGCMVIIPGSHKEGPVIHFKRRDWQICDTHVDNHGALAVPLKPGGCLFFHSLIHHGTPTNNSDLRRRAVQFHYRPESAPKTSIEERLAIFGEEGKDVTC